MKSVLSSYFLLLGQYGVPLVLSDTSHGLAPNVSNQNIVVLKKTSTFTLRVDIGLIVPLSLWTAMWQQRVDVASVRSRSFARLACRCGLVVSAARVERGATLLQGTDLHQNYNMDSQKYIVQFVKIVERFPVLYDPKLPHRTPHLCSLTWEKVAEAVRKELNEDCAVDELKSKWKGIRSSFSRFLRKIENSKDRERTKQYYLYDSLKFLHPHTKSKQTSQSEVENNDDQSSEIDEWDSEIAVQMFNEDGVDHTNSSASDSMALSMRTDSRVYPEVKIEPVDEDEVADTTNVNNDDNPLTLERDHAFKRKHTNAYEATNSKARKTEENTDLQFFKSILPDIDNFTKQEKRKFKIGVLKLIDDIENSRRDVRFNKASDKLANKNSNF